MLVIFLIIGSMILPILMVVLYKKWNWFQLLFTSVAIISVLIAGNILTFAIYDVIKHEKVFMTTIHGIFLNPLFLITGAYLGVYVIFSLLEQLFKNWSK
ncbi:transposase [Ornithinibacillus bavariensis]|uniref:transposase n=1 Tax=Ornithinibacillus bavariensis TaxID=545502 RepID=UPI001FD16DCC|nr:transposase [Ornithinibacillus bavariensis]